MLERTRSALIALTVVFVAVGLAWAEAVSNAPRSTWRERWTPPPSRERTLRVEVPDGMVLEGVLVLPDRDDVPEPGFPLAILLHSFGRSRDGLLPLADELAASGIASAVMDMRGHGSSRSTASGTPYIISSGPGALLRHAMTDLAHILKAAVDRPEVDGGRVAVVGVGEGGIVAAGIAARMPRIEALVLVDPARQETGIDVRSELERLGPRPALLVCSGIPASQRRARDLSGAGAGKRDVRCVNAFADEEGLLGYGQEATSEVVEWLAARW